MPRGGVVALSGNAVINGDAEVGPGGNPDTDITTNGNAAVNGVLHPFYQASN